MTHPTTILVKPRNRVRAAGVLARRLLDVIAGVDVHVGTFRLVGWVEGNDGSLETAVTAISDTP